MLLSSASSIFHTEVRTCEGALVIEWRELENKNFDEEPPSPLQWTELHNTQDCYQQLGVNSAATPDEIKRAYWELAMLFHPDHQPTNLRTAAETRMKELNAAYALLRHPERRAIYDAQFPVRGCR